MLTSVCQALLARPRNFFELNQVLIVHRLGMISACDSVLLAIVSGKTRDCCFEVCSWIVGEIKREEFIELIEQV
jgi:molybdopterin synthase catalytic subunit